MNDSQDRLDEEDTYMEENPLWAQESGLKKNELEEEVVKLRAKVSELEERLKNTIGVHRHELIYHKRLHKRSQVEIETLKSNAEKMSGLSSPMVSHTLTPPYHLALFSHTVFFFCRP